jgi:hypothetical protein
MTVSEQFQAYNVYLAGTAATFTQIDDPQPSAELQKIVEYGTGAVEPGLLAVGDRAPNLTFATKDLLTWASVFTGAYSGDNETKHVIAGQTGASLIRYQKTLSGSTRYGTGTNNHLVTTFRDSVCTWQSLSADHGGPASVRMRLDSIYDGTNAPISIAASQTLLGGSTPVSLYTLGPIKLNGTFLSGVMSTSVEPNANLQKLFSDGLEYPTFAYVDRVGHVITATSNSISLQQSSGYHFAVTALLVYFRRRTPNGQNYADGASQHIKLTYTNGMAYIERVEGSMGRVSIRFEMKESPTIASAQTIA